MGQKWPIGTLPFMPVWKEGDRVRIVSRPVTKEDREKHRYFGHMAGLVGVVANVYDTAEVSVKVELDSLPKVSSEVHTTATSRIQAKFAESSTEEQRKLLNSEQMKFPVNFVLLVQNQDLEAA
jgi:ribosomal protein L21E